MARNIVKYCHMANAAQAGQYHIQADKVAVKLLERAAASIFESTSDGEFRKRGGIFELMISADIINFTNLLPTPLPAFHGPRHSINVCKIKTMDQRLKSSGWLYTPSLYPTLVLCLAQSDQGA